MTAASKLIKTAAALAVIGGFGIAHAQSSLSDPKVSNTSPTVRQTVEPSSSGQRNPAGQPTRTDENVSQTVQPSSGMGGSTSTGGANNSTTGVNQDRVPNNMNSNRGAIEVPNTNRGMSGGTTGMADRNTGSMNTNNNMGSSSNMGSNNDSMRMGTERNARADRN